MNVPVVIRCAGSGWGEAGVLDSSLLLELRGIWEGKYTISVNVDGVWTAERTTGAAARGTVQQAGTSGSTSGVPSRLPDVAPLL